MPSLSSRPWTAPRLALTLALPIAIGLTACATTAEPSPSAAQPATAPAPNQAGSADAHSATGNRSVRRGPPSRQGRAQPDAGPSLAPEAQAWVDAHNRERARVSPAAKPALPAMRWSPVLAAQAQQWANRCSFEHSNADVGENLSARTHMASPGEIVGSWAAEREHFSYQSNRCAQGQVCGHYTQVVWRDSTEVGCAVASCGAGGPFGASPWVSWVCQYSPAGNWTGQRPY